MSKLRALAALAAVALVTACTDLHAELQDQNGKWVESCRGMGFGLLTGLIAHAVYDDCMEKARIAGLKPID
jgi:hypothetical protein